METNIFNAMENRFHLLAGFERDLMNPWPHKLRDTAVVLSDLSPHLQQSSLYWFYTQHTVQLLLIFSDFWIGFQLPEDPELLSRYDTLRTFDIGPRR